MLDPKTRVTGNEGSRKGGNRAGQWSLSDQRPLATQLVVRTATELPMIESRRPLWAIG